MSAPPERVFRALREIARALFSTPAPVPEARLDGLLLDLKSFLAAAGTTPTRVLRASVLLVQFSPVVLLGKPCRFSSLSLEERGRCLDRIERTPLRYPYWVVKLYLAMLFFEPVELSLR